MTIKENDRHAWRRLELMATLYALSTCDCTLQVGFILCVAEHELITDEFATEQLKERT